MRERRRRKWQTDSAYREKQRARDREAQRKQRFKKVYGISLADYDVMLAQQGGACAICKISGAKLCVDHCHATGKVRGLLCAKCNSALGFCNDDPNHFLAAIAYLQAARGKEQAPSLATVACREAHQCKETGASAPENRACPTLSLTTQSRISPGVT